MRFTSLDGARRTRRAVAVATATSALLLTAACGGSSNAGSGGNTSTDFDPDGVLTVGVNFGQVTVLDPLDDTGSTVPQSYISHLIYGQLLDEGDPISETLPGLVTEWATPDDNTVQLTLRDDAKFSDGTPFDAEAVKFSWERCASAEGFKLDLFASLESVTADDATHVTVQLSRPFAGAWIGYLLRQGVFCSAIVSPTAVEKEGDNFAIRPVGAGPYMVDTVDVGQKVSLVPNPHYYAPEEQTFARIDFVQTAAGAATVTALTSQQVDVSTVSPSSVDALTGRNIEIVNGPSSTTTYVNMCTTQGPMADVDARRAVVKAIDPEEINEAVYRGKYTVNRQLLPEFHPYRTETGADETAFDLEEAKSLAESSGLSGQSLDLMFFSTSPEYATMAELIKSQLAEIGVEVTLVPTQNPFADKQAKKPDLEIWAFYPESILTTLTPGQINNPCGTDVPELNEALESVFRADEAAAAAAWDEAQAIVSDQALVAPLVNNQTLVARTEKVAGELVLPTNTYALVDWTKIGMGR